MAMTMQRNPDKEVFCLGSAVDDEDAAAAAADDDDDDDDDDEHVNEDLGSCDG